MFYLNCHIGAMTILPMYWWRDRLCFTLTSRSLFNVEIHHNLSIVNS
jgi:hypothetical protein